MKFIKQHRLNSFVLLFSVNLATGFASDSIADAPNIVLILADDLGYGDVMCNHPKSLIPTPNIDKLASQGRRFTEAHTPASVCSPTRYGLLTGRYAWRTAMKEGVLYDYDPALIKKGRLTVASLLKDAGYHTGVFGKWHVGLDWAPKEGDPGDWQPTHMGFDRPGQTNIGQLYDFANDPGETKDLWAEQPEIVKHLRDRLDLVMRQGRSRQAK
jgi:arylsulfatase A-like enzyme